MSLSRREFLKFLGLSALSPLVLSCSKAGITQPESSSKFLGFKALAPSSRDELLLAEGFSYKILRHWNDPLGLDSSHKEISFGVNNDFTCFMPLSSSGELLYSNTAEAKTTNHALLWVNHELTDPNYHKGQSSQEKSVGASIFRIERDQNGLWNYAEAQTINSKQFNRRIDARTKMQTTGPVASIFPQMKGTLANCSGGKTPWMTVLTCEENYDAFPSKFNWKNFNEKHYGWVVEADPYDRNSTPKKHTSLGRIAHENAAITISSSGKVIVYMGDDKEDEHIYKFISHRKYREGDRAYNMKLLEDGDLYVAKLDKEPNVPSKKNLAGKGSWELLSVDNPKLKNKFKNQAELLIETRAAAKELKATALDRPEDLEISPIDKSVFVSLTNNGPKLNFYGSIMKIKEENEESLDFDYSFFVLGSSEANIACPDNLAFDDKANLWVTTDISGLMLNKYPYKFHRNNALFVIPTLGPNAGKAYRFATAPLGAELTGPSFSEDFKTLFLSVQHPGEYGLESKWPHDPQFNFPRSAVVAIDISALS